MMALSFNLARGLVALAVGLSHKDNVSSIVGGLSKIQLKVHCFGRSSLRMQN